MTEQQIQLMPEGSRDTEADPLPRADWESIRILNSYRLFIAIALIVAFLADVRTVDFGVTAPLLFYTRGLPLRTSSPGPSMAGPRTPEYRRICTSIPTLSC